MNAIPLRNFLSLVSSTSNLAAALLFMFVISAAPLLCSCPGSHTVILHRFSLDTSYELSCCLKSQFCRF